MLHHWKKVEHKPISSHKTLLNLKLLTFGISHLEKIKQICNNKEEQKVNKNLFLIIINFLTKTSCKKLRAASRDLLFTKMAWSNWCVFFYKIKKIEKGINKIYICIYQIFFKQYFLDHIENLTTKVDLCISLFARFISRAITYKCYCYILCTLVNHY